MDFDILNDDHENEPMDDQESNNSHKNVNNENLEPAKHHQSPVKQQQNSNQNSGISSKTFFKHETYNKPANKQLSTSANNNSMLNSTASASQFKLFSISSLNPYQNK